MSLIFPNSTRANYAVAMITIMDMSIRVKGVVKCSEPMGGVMIKPPLVNRKLFNNLTSSIKVWCGILHNPHYTVHA